jgi:hypothetical protein
MGWLACLPSILTSPIHTYLLHRPHLLATLLQFLPCCYSFLSLWHSASTRDLQLFSALSRTPWRIPRRIRILTVDVIGPCPSGPSVPLTPTGPSSSSSSSPPPLSPPTSPTLASRIRFPYRILLFFPFPILPFRILPFLLFQSNLCCCLACLWADRAACWASFSLFPGLVSSTSTCKAAARGQQKPPPPPAS